MNNMNDLFKQAQDMQKKMQEDIKKNQDLQRKKEYKGAAGVDMVEVVLNGEYQLKSLILSDELLQENKNLVEDLIASAVNQAVNKVSDAKKSDLSDLAQHINIPKDFKFPF
jgi:nucleoid-associated protein EbfC